MLYRGEHLGLVDGCLSEVFSMNVRKEFNIPFYHMMLAFMICDITETRYCLFYDMYCHNLLLTCDILDGMKKGLCFWGYSFNSLSSSVKSVQNIIAMKIGAIRMRPKIMMNSYGMCGRNLLGQLFAFRH